MYLVGMKEEWVALGAAGTGGAGEEGAAEPLAGTETEPARERDRARVEGGVVTEEEVVEDMIEVAECARGGWEKARMGWLLVGAREGERCS